MNASMGGDCTLVDSEILARVEDDEQFIEHFDLLGLKGASYDIHVGDQMYVTYDETVTKHPVDLQDERYANKRGFRIEPGQSVVLRSRECLRMPSDMYGRLSLRSTWGLRGLSYAGGVIDPGWWGHLFLSVVNDSEDVIEIPVRSREDEDFKREDALVTVQFIQLSSAAQNPLRMDRLENLPTNRRPPSRTYLRQEYQDILKKLKEEMDEELQNYKTRVDSVVRIVELGFFALIAGVTASVGGALVQYGGRAGGIAELLVGLGALFLFALLMFVLGRIRPRRS